MKATGIVRRIDSSVIMGTKVGSLENTGFFADFVRFLEAPGSVMSCHHNGDNAEEGGAASKSILHSASVTETFFRLADALLYSIIVIVSGIDN